jgi:predicted secreted protein
MWARVMLATGVVCLAMVNCVALRAQTVQDETARPDKAAQATGAAGETANPAKVSVEVVFAAGNQFIDSAKAACQDFHSDKLQDCFAREMQRANASPMAVAFTQQLGEPGFVRDYKVAGAVDIAYVVYPYRANENESCLIVNGDPAIVDVDNHKLLETDALKHNAAYIRLAKTHKQISLWPGDRYATDTPDVEMGANAGAHIVVNYRLREQCHACAVLGHAWYAFDFDPKGKFEGARLFAVSLARAQAAPARDARKTIALEAGQEVTIALPVKSGTTAEWMLSKALDSSKVRLIEHSHVAPPTKSGGPGREELWKFALFRAGTTDVEFQRMGASATEAGKPVRFKVVVGTGSGVHPASKP